MVYLGYVFLFKGFINDFYRIIVYKWSVSLLLCKILINVLFNKDQVLVVFGYEVEQEFIKLLEEDQYKEYYFFQKFKM